MSKHMIEKQKKWSKPQLLILGRGKTEENVLAGCKGNNIDVSFKQKYNRCSFSDNCFQCNAIAAS